MLVGANGYTYEEAAVICRVETGTIKSRLSRARSKLIKLLDLPDLRVPARHGSVAPATKFLGGRVLSGGLSR